MNHQHMEKPGQRKLVFLSHASPEDNYLAGWLASKLKLLGYQVWVDIKNLRAGNAFWAEIENKMRQDSICFIALVSTKYIEKAKNPSTGVHLEVNLAKVVAKQLKNYTIPLRIDKSSFDDFPVSFLPLNAVDFSDNWGLGLKELLHELEEKSIPKEQPVENALSLWHEYQRIEGKIELKRDFYSSNWFRISIPKDLFIYRFTEDIDTLYDKLPSFVRNGDYIMGFFSDEGVDLHHTYSERLDTDLFHANDSIDLKNGGVLKDASNKLVSLLNKSIADHFYGLENFGAFKGAGKKRIFYVKYDSEGSGYVSLKAFKKRGRKLYSKSNNLKWRFGLSFKFQLEPFPHLSVMYHLVSSNDEGLLDKDAQIRARRSIPSDWFNRDWYERILAFMYLGSCRNPDLELRIPVGHEDIIVDLKPVTFVSNKGYHES